MGSKGQQGATEQKRARGQEGKGASWRLGKEYQASRLLGSPATFGKAGTLDLSGRIAGFIR